MISRSLPFLPIELKKSFDLEAIIVARIWDPERQEVGWIRGVNIRRSKLYLADLVRL
jgi:hypothetical protein